MQELIDILTAMASKKGEIGNPLELFLDMAERIVKSVSIEFGAKNDEVAILVLTSDQKHLRFAAPRKFADLGTIPISKRDSIAVNVLARKAGEAMNNVPMVRHVSFFESVKIRDRPAVPIQKMITVPILLRGEVVGVAQVSRKGDSAAEAGPDFTQSDVDKAQDLFSRISPYLLEARPERF
ncbi:MAG: hypothetical protein DMF83_14210 [Acidobacteria bacterium]|nr:MAG: hypothetical protein DMF83_14210 [Acidobacteriota bacterium]